MGPGEKPKPAADDTVIDFDSIPAESDHNLGEEYDDEEFWEKVGPEPTDFD